jgi:hypothetical protein
MGGIVVMGVASEDMGLRCQLVEGEGKPWDMGELTRDENALR